LRQCPFVMAGGFEGVWAMAAREKPRGAKSRGGGSFVSAIGTVKFYSSLRTGGSEPRSRARRGPVAAD
jgi:hypothetical protein